MCERDATSHLKKLRAATDKLFTSGLVIVRLLCSEQRGAEAVKGNPSDRHDMLQNVRNQGLEVVTTLVVGSLTANIISCETNLTIPSLFGSKHTESL